MVGVDGCAFFVLMGCIFPAGGHILFWMENRCHNKTKVLQSIENYVCFTGFFYIVKGRMIFIGGLAMVNVMIMRFATQYHLIIAILLHQKIMF